MLTRHGSESSLAEGLQGVTPSGLASLGHLPLGYVEDCGSGFALYLRVGTGVRVSVVHGMLADYIRLAQGPSENFAIVVCSR